jgi:hypothetical protein
MAHLKEQDSARKSEAPASRDVLDLMQALADIPQHKSTNKLTDTNELSITDVNGDGKTTNADVQGLLNKLKSGQGQNVAVPEPSTLALMLIPLGALIVVLPRGRGNDARHLGTQHRADLEYACTNAYFGNTNVHVRGATLLRSVIHKAISRWWC